jgi:putative NADH-flavin reductase
MKIAVIAANGRSGRIFVERAIASGHSVRAGVHQLNNLPSHKRLVVVHCDATKKHDIANLIRGQDAVVSFIGHVKGSPPRVQTVAIRVLIRAMQVEGIKRTVSLTGTGVRFKGDHITLIDRLLNMSIRLIDPARVQDGIDHVAELRRSDLNWTILRVLKLLDIKSASFTLRAHGPTRLYVSREEVADAVLQVLEQGTFVKQAPILSH